VSSPLQAEEQAAGQYKTQIRTVGFFASGLDSHFDFGVDRFSVYGAAVVLGYRTRLKMIDVLTPPNAKLLFIANSTSSARPSPVM